MLKELLLDLLCLGFLLAVKPKLLSVSSANSVSVMLFYTGSSTRSWRLVFWSALLPLLVS